MKSILQSIKPQYCELIAAGRKTIEVRKTRPKLDVPFKVYIYCTKDGAPNGYQIFAKTSDGIKGVCTGKVIGEYVCDRIIEYPAFQLMDAYIIPFLQQSLTCLTQEELWQYGKGKTLYGWRISDLKIYDKPKELSEFEILDKEFLKECPYRIRVYNNPDYTNGALLKGPYVCNNSFEPDFCRGQCEGATKPLTHPPQSWCYVEESNG